MAVNDDYADAWEAFSDGNVPEESVKEEEGSSITKFEDVIEIGFDENDVADITANEEIVSEVKANEGGDDQGHVKEIRETGEELEYFAGSSSISPELAKEKEVIESKITAQKEALKSSVTVSPELKNLNYDEFKVDYPSLVDPIKAIAFEVSRTDEVLAYITELWETIDDLQKKVYALSPTIETLKVSEEQRTIRQALAVIKKAHPDFERLVNSPELKSWIESKPPLKRSTYLEVYNTGTPADIVDMLDDYKKENGITSSTPNLQVVNKQVPASLNMAVDKGMYTMPKPSNHEPASFEEAWKEFNINNRR